MLGLFGGAVQGPTEKEGKVAVELLSVQEGTAPVPWGLVLRRCTHAAFDLQIRPEAIAGQSRIEVLRLPHVKHGRRLAELFDDRLVIRVRLVRGLRVRHERPVILSEYIDARVTQNPL